jgi:hypothetical protein
VIALQSGAGGDGGETVIGRDPAGDAGRFSAVMISAVRQLGHLLAERLPRALCRQAPQPPDPHHDHNTPPRNRHATTRRR